MIGERVEARYVNLPVVSKFDLNHLFLKFIAMNAKTEIGNNILPKWPSPDQKTRDKTNNSASGNNENSNPSGEPIGLSGGVDSNDEEFASFKPDAPIKQDSDINKEKSRSKSPINLTNQNKKDDVTSECQMYYTEAKLRKMDNLDLLQILTRLIT